MGNATKRMDKNNPVLADQAERMREKLELAYQAGLPLTESTEPQLAAALSATLRRPGSMVRAMLAYRVATASELDEARAEKLAVALEYFHTASLLFDDLPCMDDAKQRRGAPCVHERFGEGTAILAALALVNRAYGLLWRAVSGAATDVADRTLEYVEEQLGLAGLLNGQSQDLHFGEHGRNAYTPQEVALGKTVSLIKLTLVMPAMLGGASRRETQLLERVAMLWGLAYQTLDDLKDVLHKSGAAGKTAARDAHLERPNQALATGVDAAFERVETLMRLSDRTVTRLAERQPELSFLMGLRLEFDKELARLREAQETEARLALAS